MKLLSHLLIFSIGIGIYTPGAAPPDTVNVPPLATSWTIHTP